MIFVVLHFAFQQLLVLLIPSTPAKQLRGVDFLSRRSFRSFGMIFAAAMVRATRFVIFVADVTIRPEIVALTQKML